MKMPAINPKHPATRHAPALAAVADAHDHRDHHGGSAGHDHAHPREHDQGTPDHHDHPARRERRLPPSLLRMSLVGRLTVAAGLSALIWVAVVWAVSPIAG